MGGPSHFIGQLIARFFPRLFFRVVVAIRIDRAFRPSKVHKNVTREAAHFIFCLSFLFLFLKTECLSHFKLTKRTYGNVHSKKRVILPMMKLFSTKVS